MAIRVPVSPQTRAPQGQVGYERPTDVTAGIRALGDVVRHYGEYVQAEDKKRELFDVQKRVVDEANALQTDFEERQQKAPLGAAGFTQEINDNYTVRHQQLVQDLKSRGYSKDAINEFETRLGTIRGQYIAKAIDFQDKSRFTKNAIDSRNLAVNLGHYLGEHPEAVYSVLDELKTSVANLGMDEVEQATLYEQGKEIALAEGRSAYAFKHPEVVLGIYGFPGELTTTSPANLPDGQQFDLPTYLKKLSPVEGTAKNSRSSAKGHFQFLKSTWIEEYKQVFGNTKETDEQILAKRKDRGIATKVAEHFTSKNIQKLVDAGLPVNDATVYLTHFLGTADAIKVLSAHADETIGKLVRSEAVEANPGVFKKINTAADLISWAQDKMGVEPPAVPQTQIISAASPAQAPVVDASGKTGIPILDLSSGPERMQMLQTARVIMNEREADAKATQREAHNTWYNDFLNKLQDGKYGQTELNTALQKGLITDYDERHKAQIIIDAKNKKNDDLDRFHLMLNSGQKFNPFDDDAQKAADAGFENAVKFSIQHPELNNSPYAIALRIWDRTGILPKQGAIMLRGGLVSTDPAQVAASASVASNMLERNPNAFAGVDGGEEIGIAASNYAHYVDDLGMTAQQAANTIATQNSPEFKAKAKADEPTRNKFIDKVRGTGKTPGIDIQAALNNALQGELGYIETGLNIATFGGYKRARNGAFTSNAQVAEANQTFLELALVSYDKNHDEGAAIKYATDQMTRFYGVDRGRLMKFPASKAYPQIMGSREYIYDQAKEEVDKFAGFAVPKENIWLVPTTSAADAFRAGRPVPYEVHYTTERDGQKVYHVIPGKSFIADVEKGKADAAKKAREEEKRIRSQSPYTSGPQFGG